jgi:ribosomal protein L37AE/L43A
MGLRVECPQCGLKTIPRRIIGVYVGSADSIKIWECRECSYLWSNYTSNENKVEGISVSSA